MQLHIVHHGLLLGLNFSLTMVAGSDQDTLCSEPTAKNFLTRQ
jgi:hypothetical protein